MSANWFKDLKNLSATPGSPSFSWGFTGSYLSAFHVEILLVNSPLRILPGFPFSSLLSYSLRAYQQSKRHAVLSPSPLCLLGPSRPRAEAPFLFGRVGGALALGS